jgi:hypothetical protein
MIQRRISAHLCQGAEAQAHSFSYINAILDHLEVFPIDGFLLGITV